MIYNTGDYLVLNEPKELLILSLFVVICILWAYIFVMYFRSRSRTPRINSNQFHTTIKVTDKSYLEETKILSPLSHHSLPFVSVIVPARNEEKHIHRCLLSLLAQDYPNFEIIVIDDNSTDNTLKTIENIKKGTSKIHHMRVEKRQLLSAKDKLKILSLTDKPHGWAGKTWASEQGYLHSKGSILLFTDGDTYYGRKDVISLTLSYMQKQNLDVLTGIPSIGKVHDFWSRLILPLWTLVSILFGVNNTAEVNNPKSKFAYLMGSFFIVKRKVFEGIGTFKSVREALQEDKALGVRIKRRGYNMKIVRLDRMISAIGSRGDICTLWHFIGRTLAPLIVKNKVKVVANLLIIFLVSFLPFIILPFTFFSTVREQTSFPVLALSMLKLSYSQPEFNYHHLILSINIICCLITIIATSIIGIKEYRLPPAYSLLSFFAAIFIIIACTYSILPLLVFNKTRPIMWRGRKYIYKKEQEGFSI
jgi:glycosyltransferase involved in cell wall biosynthesis